ncbi:MAG TPA: ferredoxin--NADP(+) reductase [Rhodospirillaceae bacterium]|nr:ferredoxin--NADP(+) reductase [Rhodospirillaceae bacterium]HAA92154.1 ferredoxin--NADP(+) reductase [Rhodospirillaceae bacterium]HAT36054.1 ferredoxin--NADP(+) reductase [Rhodospirillaceae bacterium]
MALESQDHPVPNALTQETVLSVKHWTDRMFSFRVSRPASFRFRSGEFIMLGIFKDDKPLLRAYSVASPAWDDELEFFSIKVQDGPLTSRLQHLKPGDKILLGKKPTGTLILDTLTPAKNLYMFSTGTGIAPFVSLIRDPETYEKFENVVLTHTCRTVAELQYGYHTVSSLEDDPLIGEFVNGRLIHDTSVTQEKYHRIGRITTRIENGELFRAIDKAPLEPKNDRVMICGSMDMLKDTSAIVEALGFVEGSNAAPAEYVIEKAFAD